MLIFYSLLIIFCAFYLAQKKALNILVKSFFLSLEFYNYSTVTLNVASASVSPPASVKPSFGFVGS